MIKAQLDLIYKEIGKYSENNKGEYPIAITLHISKKNDLIKEIGLLCNNSAIQFDQVIGSFFIFGIKVWFSAIIEPDIYLLSGVKPD